MYRKQQKATIQPMLEQFTPTADYFLLFWFRFEGQGISHQQQDHLDITAEVVIHSQLYNVQAHNRKCEIIYTYIPWLLLLLDNASIALTSGLHASSNTLHSQEEGILKPRSILACRIELHQLSSRVVEQQHFFGFLWLLCNMKVTITNPLERIRLDDIEGCKVGITEMEPLLKVRIFFQKIIVPSNLWKIIGFERELG